MPDNDDIIDEAVVRVSPDLTGFRAKLEKGLAAATKGITVKIRIVADATGWRNSVKEALDRNRNMAGGKPVTAKVKLVADAAGFGKSVTNATKGKTATVKVKADTSEAKADIAEVAAEAGKVSEQFLRKVRRRRVAGSRRSVRNFGERVERDQITALDRDAQRDVTRIRSRDEGIERAHDQAYAREKNRIRSETEGLHQVEDQAHARDADRDATRIRGRSEKRQQAEDQAYDAEAQRDITRIRGRSERRSQAEDQAYAADADRNARRSRNRIEDVARAVDAAYDEDARRRVAKARTTEETVTRTIIVAREQAYAQQAALDRKAAADQDKINRQMLVQRANTAKSFKSAITAPKILNMGGEGIRPTNLLLGVVVALTPALFSMGASALQASTSVAALGAAGIGAATGLTALFGAFGNVGEALALSKSATKTAAGAAPATQARSNARQLVNARRSIEDANRRVTDSERNLAEAMRDVGKARQEAIRDLRDLREAVSDLQLQESGDKLSVKEAQLEYERTSRNYWATTLEKEQALQRLREAEERLSDTQRDRADKTKELADAEKRGIGGSEKVRDAQRRVDDQRRALADARRSVVEANENLAAAQETTNAAMDGGSAAARELEKKLAQLTPAARELYELLKEGGPASAGWKAFQRRMEEATLPGFTRFLRDIGVDGKDTNSLLGIIADSADNMGHTFSDVFTRLGKISKQEWFRNDLRAITQENDKAFANFGDTVVILIRPLMQIFRAASPLLTRFSQWLEDTATNFSEWINAADKSGGLTRWFQDAGDQLARWGRLAWDALRVVGGFFNAAVPGSGSLVDRLGGLVKGLADWANSSNGQKQLTDFFNKVASFDYAGAAKFIGQLTVLLTTYAAIKFVAKHPISLLFAAIAAVNPAATAWIVDNLAKGLSTVFQWARDNPAAAVALTGLLLAAKGLGKGGVLQLLMPGDGAIKSFMGKLLGATTGTMHVTAGAVYVNGGIGGVPGGKGGVPGGPVPVPGLGTPKAPEAGGWKKFWGGLGRTAGGLFRTSFWALIAYEILDVTGLKDVLVKQINQAWAPIVSDVERFFSHTLPNAINLGEGSGWSDLGTNLKNELTALLGLEPGGWLHSILGRAEVSTIPPADRPEAPFKESLREYLERNKSSNFPQFAHPLPVPTDKIKAEADAFQKLTDSMRDNTGVSADNWKELRSYVAERKESVKAMAEHIRSTQGEAKAEEYLQQANQRSKATLQDVLVQMGWNAADAQRYTDKLYGIPTARETKIAADTKPATSKADELQKKYDELVREKKTKLTVEGQEKVQTELDKIMAQQLALQLGIGVQQAAKEISKGHALDEWAKRTYGDRKAAGGYIRGPGGPRGDKIPAWLSDREFVEPAHVVDHYGVGAMENIRQKRIPKWAMDPGMYAAGGPVTWPFKVDISKTKIPPALGAMLGSGAAWAGKIPTGIGAVAGLNAQAMNAAIDAHNRFPWARVTSGKRHTYTHSGHQSLHNFGRATDWSPHSMELFNYFAAKYPYAAELIYSPAGGRQIWKGKPHMYSGAVRADHWDHVHLALRDGGQVSGGRRARLYDNGGVLPPGATLAVNNTGRDEYVSATPGGGPVRLDKRDLVALANYMVQAMSGQQIRMDGRKVAEVVRAYDYLPGAF